MHISYGTSGDCIIRRRKNIKVQTRIYRLNSVVHIVCQVVIMMVGTENKCVYYLHESTIQRYLRIINTYITACCESVKQCQTAFQPPRSPIIKYVFCVVRLTGPLLTSVFTFFFSGLVAAHVYRKCRSTGLHLDDAPMHYTK